MARVVLVAVTVLYATRSASAAGDTSNRASAGGASPYEVTPVADTVATTSLVLSLAAVSLFRTEQNFLGVCDRSGDGRCKSRRLTVVDRYSVGKSSQAWQLVSDVAQASAIGLPFVLDGIDVWISRWKKTSAEHSINGSTESGTGFWSDFGADALVMLQAQLFAGMASNLLKVATHRPRPRQFDSDTYVAVAQSEQSFPCGHCVAIVSGASAYATTFWLRHPESPWRYWVAAGAGAFSAVGSWARVEAGQHFPSDVMFGVALGAVSGIGIPLLHLQRDRSSSVPSLAFVNGPNDGKAVVATISY